MELYEESESCRCLLREFEFPAKFELWLAEVVIVPPRLSFNGCTTLFSPAGAILKNSGFIQAFMTTLPKYQIILSNLISKLLFLKIY